jgi:sodium-dependent dicarboxylate transporter 2/3/5
MKRYRIFFISLILFIVAFTLVDILKLSVWNLKEINLKVLLLFVYAIYMWTARVMPDSFISIFVILLIGVFKLDTFSNVISYTFGNTIFIFLFSIIIISYAFKKSGLAVRIGHGLIKRFGNSSWKTLFSLMFASYILSMFLTSIAGVSLALPIALEMIEANRLKKGDTFAKACMLGITYAGLIGGIATPLGTPVNLLMMQYLHKLGNYDLTFLHWVEIGVPLSFILLTVCFLVLILSLKIKNYILEVEYSEMGPLSKKEIKVTISFCIIIILFLFSQFLESNIGWIALNMNSISVICCLMVVIPPFEIIEWKDTLKNMDWESLLFLIGSIALGYLLYNTQTAAIIAQILFIITGSTNLYAYIFIFGGFTILMHIPLSSNTVMGTVIVPIMISFAQQKGVTTWYVIAPVIYCISLAFILPTESPTNIITYNTGFYELKDMLKTGTVLTVICLVVVCLFLITVGSATGLYTIG